MRPISLITTFFLLLAIAKLGLAQTRDATYRIETESRSYVGRPLAVDSSSIALLRTNGRISFIPKTDIKSTDKISERFDPLTSTQLRTGLQKEFGARYEVTTTRHFVVVHSPGGHQTWAVPFEKLYDQMRHYFGARGISLDTPEFVMVAIVLNSRDEFDAFLRAYVKYDANIHGYYSPLSNRIITYRQPDGELDFFQLSTVIHEAAHQVAFNTGLHSRVAQTPRWASEGLATMFEARGVHSSYRYNGLSERINQGQLKALAQYSRDGKVRGKLQALISGDELFEREPLLAYSLAWAVTFYVCETRPADYSRYMNRLRNRPDFQEYTAKERLKDFQDLFGNDLNDFEIRMLQYLSGLK
ncbi:MAG: DUF1570 domain-containing protein [Pirellulaceae bacterium]